MKRTKHTTEQIIRILRDADSGVPEEISVTGFVDLPVGEFSNPRLTSVRLPAQQLGEQVARQLVEWSESGVAPLQLAPLPVSLIVRDSTGPAHQP